MAPFGGQKVKVTGSISTMTENQRYCRKGKAYELQTWYMDRVRTMALVTDMRSDINGQGHQPFWVAVQTLAWHIVVAPVRAAQLVA